MKHEFEVPTELMVDFANTLAEKDLPNEILGATDDDEIIVVVEYEKKHKNTIYKLHELIDTFNEENEEEEDDETDEVEEDEDE